MSGSVVLQIAITIIGSSALFSFIQFLIQRKDTKEEKNKEDKFKKIEEGFQSQFEEHDKCLQNIMKNHSDDLQSLLKTFEELKEQDQRIEDTINQIAKNQLNVCDALTGLAHDKIIYMTDKITERGYITLKEKATLDSIYLPYKAMGGNSHAKAGYEHVVDLEVVSDQKAKSIDDMIKLQRREETKKQQSQSFK